MSGVSRHLKKGSSQPSKVSDSLYIKGSTMKQAKDQSGIMNTKESLEDDNDEYQLAEGIKLFAGNQNTRIEIRNNDL